MALGRKPIEIVNDGKHQLLAKAEHWDRIYLKEVAKVQNGYAFSSDYFTKSDGMPLIRIRDIDSYTTVDKFSGKYNEDFVVKKGDILIGMDGDFKTARWKGESALLNQRVCRIIPNSKKYNDKFLVFCLQPFLDAIHAETSSVTVKHISSKTIEEIPLPLPPKKEQDNIVSKIEELFSELDKGIENLRTAQQQLKTYRQSVLKWAFEGKLTNENVKEGKLPKGRKRKRLGDMFDFVGGGTPSKSEKDYWNGNIYWASVKDVKGDYLNKTQDTITEKGLKNSASNLAQPGDVILITRISPGKSIISNVKSAINQDLKIAKPKFKTTSKFINYFFNAIERDCIKIASGTTVLGITLNNLNELEIPDLDIEEQNNLVQEIESRLSVADKMEESITQSLQQAEALRQSILKKAFEGRLV